MEIGVIDTGVDKNHKRLQNTHIHGITIYKAKDGRIVRLKDKFEDNKGHGTGIVSIIKKHVPEANIRIVKVDSFCSKISEDILEDAFLYLIENTNVRIINVSMGINTNNPSRALKNICDQAIKKNIIIVASAHYKYDNLCFPAHFKSVFSVGNGIVKNKGEFRYMEGNITNVLCKGGFQRVAVPGNQFSFSAGTSLATAHFTGIISKSYKEGEWADFNSLKIWMKEHSNNDIISFTKHDRVTSETQSTSHNMVEKDFNEAIKLSNETKKIAIFPFEEKEMKTLIEFRENLKYSLEFAIGYPRSIKRDKTVVKLLEEKEIIFTTKLPSIKEYDLFDTLVVGYFLDKLSDHHAYFGYSLIKECLKRNKNFVVWDKTVYDLINHILEDNNFSYSGKVFLTSFDEERKNLLFSNMDYFELQKPSICVVGTGSRQGKFTTQLTLKKILKEHGYRVSHISTEPQGIMFDTSATFPIGHKGTVSINLRDWYKTLRFLTQYIEENEETDIILTGSQGGILPLHPVNESTSLEKLTYVKSFYPDAIVCTISPNDSIDFIKRTVDTIKSFVKTEILFYVLTPFRYKFHHGQNNSIVSFEKMEDDEYNTSLSFYKQELGKEVVNIKDESFYPSMFSCIIDFFQQKNIKNEI